MIKTKIQYLYMVIKIKDVIRIALAVNIIRNGQYT